MDDLSIDLTTVTLTAAGVLGIACTVYIVVTGKASIERARRISGTRPPKGDDRDDDA